MSEYVAFSGGADSTALSILMEDAQPIFTDTGWEFPELYDHIDRFEDITGRKVIRIKNDYPGGLVGRIRDYLYFPNVKTRFCTDQFKIKPFDDFMKSYDVLMIGLRADEPDRKGNSTNKYSIRYPLREWGINKTMVDAICKSANLHPSYPPYMIRGGCIGCFFKRKTEIEAMYHLNPKLFWQLVDLEEEIQDERNNYYYMFNSVGMGLRKFAESLKSQPLFFPVNEMYSQDVDTTPCGLFCNR